MLLLLLLLLMLMLLLLLLLMRLPMLMLLSLLMLMMLLMLLLELMLTLLLLLLLLLQDGTRAQDWVQKSVQFHSIALSPLKTDADTSELYAVGSDACIKQIQQSQLVGCFETGENQGAIAALESGRAFFTGNAVPGLPGFIRCYKAPLTGEFGKYTCHAGPVTRLAVAAHDFILLSAGQDGVLCVWNVNDRDRAPLEHSGLEYTAEVLVDRAHLMEKQSQLIELERQVEDITNQMVFQQRRFEAQHRDAMNQLEVRFNKELSAERSYSSNSSSNSNSNSNSNSSSSISSSRRSSSNSTKGNSSNSSSSGNSNSNSSNSSSSSTSRERDSLQRSSNHSIASSHRVQKQLQQQQQQQQQQQLHLLRLSEISTPFLGGFLGRHAKIICFLSNPPRTFLFTSEEKHERKSNSSKDLSISSSSFFLGFAPE
ncbi:hypothetical protein ACSSS7_007322 [Eimeria intestinalis]